MSRVVGVRCRKVEFLSVVGMFLTFWLFYSATAAIAVDLKHEKSSAKKAPKGHKHELISAASIKHSTNAPLSLKQAEVLALQNDSLVNYFQEKANALAEISIAVGRLPDPQLRIGIVNAPVDSFDLDRQAMTQKIIGINQMFPDSSLRKHKSNKISFLGEAQKKKAAHRRLITLRATRKAWIHIFHFHHAFAVIRQSQKLFGELIDITRLRYGAGRGNQQNILLAELELSQLKDKEIELQSNREKATAKLRVLIGAKSLVHPLSLDNLDLREIPELSLMEARLKQHPLLEISRMSLQAAKEEIDVSMAKYVPKWGVNVSYGRRTMEIGGEKVPDFFSAMLSLNLPIFNANLQDKWLAASKNEYMAAQYKVDDQLQELKRMLHVEYASWRRFGERVAYYRSTLIPKSEQNAKASLMAYQSQVSVFTALMRARLKELKTKLQALNLVVDHTIAQVNLLYLLGEET